MIERTGFSLVRFLAFCTVGLTLAGCVGTTALSELEQSRPLGGPFSQSLFRNYAALAHSFGTVGAPSSGTPFDAPQAISLGSMSADVADIANLYAAKALASAQGEEVLPEEANADLKDAEPLRVQLLRDLNGARDAAPAPAARAQADYDCWIINSRSEALQRAAQQCRRSLGYTLAALEHDLAAAPPAVARPADTSAGGSPP